MRLDNAMEDVAANETEITVDGDCCSSDEIPCARSVVRESWVGMLEIGDGDCITGNLR